MRRLQAGLFPEARRRIGKCLDCGAEGAVAVGGGEAGFLVGACAQMEEQALANKMTAPERANRAVILFARDRKSTRLNSSHQIISYAVFCLKKKKRVSIEYPRTSSLRQK